MSEETKSLTHNEFQLEFRKINGVWRISLRQICDYYEIEFSYASQKITRNRELFRDLGLDSVTLFSDGKVVDYLLTVRDGVQFLTLLNYKRYKDERRTKLIGLKNWMADDVEKALIGDVLERKEIRTKQIQGHHIMTAELKEHKEPITEPDKRQWIYTNYAKMIHRIVFGYHENGIRETASKEELMAIGSICEWIGAYLDAGETNYTAHKDMVERRFRKHYPKLYEKRELRLLDIEKQKLEAKTRKKLKGVSNE